MYFLICEALRSHSEALFAHALNLTHTALLFCFHDLLTFVVFIFLFPGMIPLWLFTLGRLIYEEGDIVIPFQNIIFSLVGALTPVVIGLFLQRKFPRVAQRFVKLAKYVMAIFIVFCLTVGIYINVYIFYLVNWKVLLAATLLPYSGFFFGCFCAFVLRQDKANIIAIAVETGIQNTGLPIVILQTSLTGPEKATSLVPPVMSALFTPLPLVAAVICIQTRAWLKRRREAGREEEQEEFQIKYEESRNQLLDDTVSSSEQVVKSDDKSKSSDGAECVNGYGDQ